jgi:hypothetical protein
VCRVHIATSLPVLAALCEATRIGHTQHPIWCFCSRSEGPRAKGKAVPVLNTPRHEEDVWGSGGIAPPFLASALDVHEWSVSRSGSFSFSETPPPPRYSLGRRLSGPQRRSGRCGQQKSLPCWESRPSRLQAVPISTELSCFPQSKSVLIRLGHAVA